MSQQSVTNDADLMVFESTGGCGRLFWNFIQFFFIGLFFIAVTVLLLNFNAEDYQDYIVELLFIAFMAISLIIGFFGKKARRVSGRVVLTPDHLSVNDEIVVAWEQLLAFKLFFDSVCYVLLTSEDKRLLIYNALDDALVSELVKRTPNIRERHFITRRIDEGIAYYSGEGSFFRIDLDNGSYEWQEKDEHDAATAELAILMTPYRRKS